MDLRRPISSKGVPASPRLGVLSIVGALAAMAFVMLLPRSEALPVEGQRAAALFAGILVLWATEAIPIAVTALLVVVLQPVLGLASLVEPEQKATTGAIMRAAMTNFMSPVFFFVLVMFFIAFAWVKTGLAGRFALWLITQAGTDARRVVYVFMIGTGAVSTIVSDVPAAAIFMAIALGIFDRLGLAPGSRFAKVLMLGIPIAALIGGVGTPAGSSINLLGLSMIEQNGGERVPFLHWMAIGIPMVVVLLPVAAWVLVRFYPPEIESIGDTGELAREREALGPMSRSEWKVIAIMSVMLALWIYGTWEPALDIFLVSMLGACSMFLPRIGLFSWKEAEQATGWEALLMIGGVTSLGQASAKTGLAKWMAEIAFGGLQDTHVLVVIALISVFTVVVHLVLPIAPVINAVMIPPIMVLATSAGVNPALYALPVIFTASCAFLLPLDAVPLVTYGKGYYKMLDMLLPGAVISIVWVVLITVLLLVIGPLVGLL